MRLQFFRGKWAIYWREEGNPRRVSLRTADKDIAEQRFRDFQKQLERPKETVGDIFPAYMSEKGDKEKHTWKPLKKFFENYRPDEITKDVCRKYIDERRKVAIKDGTIHRELGILRAAIRWHNPNTKAIFELPKKPPPKEHYLTKEQYKALVGAAKAPHMKLFIVMAISTAGRVGAILDLTWDRVEFDRGIIRLAKGDETRTKGRATIPMTETARKALEQAYKARLSDYVIEYSGKQIASIRKGLAEAAKRAKLENVTPHVLRHSAAVWMAEAGTPMSEISQYLGHTSTKVTETVYARYSPEYLKKAANALEVDGVDCCSTEHV